MILLDTNVISELVKPMPNAAVIAYFTRISPDALFTAAVCEAELRYGLSRMPDGRRRTELSARIDQFLEKGFPNQILPFDRLCARAYGEIRQLREIAGRPIAVEDAMILATARAYGAHAIATRNTKDFEDCGVTLVDPWRSTR